MTKNEIRAEIKAKRRGINADYKHTASHTICERVLACGSVAKAKTIAIYIDAFNEVETGELLDKLIKLGNRVCVPLCNTANDTLTLHYIQGINDLNSGAWGILEPSADAPLCDVSELDVVIVPGIAFDNEGNRIGFGKGYYDRLLEGCNATKIGICYCFQVVEHIIADPNDIKMDYIITEE